MSVLRIRTGQQVIPPLHKGGLGGLARNLIGAIPYARSQHKTPLLDHRPIRLVRNNERGFPAAKTHPAG